MINKLRIEFSIDRSQKLPINYTMGSVLQGLMMTCLDRDYGDVLHKQMLKPYSQYFESSDEKYYWVINTLTDEARENIIYKMVEQNVKSFYLKYRDSNLIVEKMKLTDININTSNPKRDIVVNFKTPTSFKRTDGKHELYPTTQYIFNSIINKYKQFINSDKLSDDLLEEIIKNVNIVGYDIKSRNYSIKGNKIPGFMGKVRFKIKGDESFVSLVNELLEFSQYCGVGIKCALGMGAVEIVK